jgi:hypothetical protein
MKINQILILHVKPILAIPIAHVSATVNLGLHTKKRVEENHMRKKYLDMDSFRYRYGSDIR